VEVLVEVLLEVLLKVLLKVLLEVLLEVMRCLLLCMLKDRGGSVLFAEGAGGNGKVWRGGGKVCRRQEGLKVVVSKVWRRKQCLEVTARFGSAEGAGWWEGQIERRTRFITEKLIKVDGRVKRGRE
jgi:hypothetical protein